MADGAMEQDFRGVGLAVPLGLRLWRGKPALSTRCADATKVTKYRFQAHLTPTLCLTELPSRSNATLTFADTEQIVVRHE